MRHMLNSTILDILAVTVIILCGLNGLRKGILLSISRLIALVAAFFGASFASDLFSPILAEYVVAPRMRTWLSTDENLTALTNAAKEAYIAFDKAVAAIKSLLSNLGIPGFISKPLAEDIAKNSDPDSILNTAVSVLSNRLSAILIYTVSFFVILAVAYLIFRFVNRVIDFTPVGAVNRFFGFVFGIALGVTLVFVVMAAVPKIVPSLGAEGMFFSAETIKNSVVMEKLTVLLGMIRDKLLK